MVITGRNYIYEGLTNYSLIIRASDHRWDPKDPMFKPQYDCYYNPD